MHLRSVISGVALAVACACNATAQSAKKTPDRPIRLTYDPIATSEHVAKEWSKVISTFPEDQRADEYKRRLLTRLPNEQDESFAYRAYYYVGSDKNLSKALESYGHLSNLGYANSHRWLFVSDAGEATHYYVDLRTASAGEMPTIWVNERERGILRSSNRWEYNCQRRESRSTSYTEYDPTGLSTGSTSMPTSWRPVIPGSVGESFLDFSCS